MVNYRLVCYNVPVYARTGKKIGRRDERIFCFTNLQISEKRRPVKGGCADEGCRAAGPTTGTPDGPDGKEAKYGKIFWNGRF